MMASNRERRVAKELRDINADREQSGVFAETIDSANLMHLRGTIPGPPDTPYAGGTFLVDIQIPDTYPFKPPKMKFVTRMWHPNISSVTGAICLDILGANWSPVQNIKSALMSLRLLLENPNPKDPQDAEVSKMLLQEPDRFAFVANDWAAKHAGAPVQVELVRRSQSSRPRAPDNFGGWHKDVIGKFSSMGFVVDDVVRTFQTLNIDKHNGQYFELEDAFTGDIIAALLGEN